MRCGVGRCHNEAEVIVLGVPHCDEHWQERCSKPLHDEFHNQVKPGDL